MYEQLKQTNTMTTISLQELVDDILLLVRNNNISESEDLSRAQIISWVKAYKNKLHKDRMDQLKEQAKQTQELELLVDGEFLTIKEIGPMELIHYKDTDDEDIYNTEEKRPIFTKVTKDKLEDVFNNSEQSILWVRDREGENLQYMNHIRRHYQYFRKHTFGEMTAYYKDDGHIYVQGLTDMGKLKYIWVKAIFEEPDDTEDDGLDEKEVKIPGWMVPTIKELILKNELAFMLNRPSDDSNNATLASVKPHGPQDDEE